MSQVSVQEEKKEPRREKLLKRAENQISDELLERAFQSRGDTSEIKALVERISKGPILSKENRAIEVVPHNVGAVGRSIKEMGLKGKVKAKSTEKGKANPSMVWR